VKSLAIGVLLALAALCAAWCEWRDRALTMDP
jgi:type VI protein secretion system component VasK